MAGIYIHIPFCKKACHYCNFHFSTSFGLKEALVAALIKEIELQKAFLKTSKIETIYFGGGTPSVLEATELEAILSKLYVTHDLSSSIELTLEANPDDLTKEKLTDLKALGFNRLSIGIQSFHEADLVWMNRSHDTQQAKNCIETAQDLGLEDLSIDLIFGSNTTTTTAWEKNLQTAVDYNIPHLSCYGLTVEEGTALAHQIKTEKTAQLNNNLSAEQFELTSKFLKTENYEHYEISNYARDGRYSKHNTNYWLQVPYLGIGPAAHSYDGTNRQWNIANNKKYITALAENNIPATQELLSVTDRFNECLMTGLRTMWGCKLDQLTAINAGWKNMLAKDLTQLIDADLLRITNGYLILTEAGKLLGDKVMSQLFITN